jgi:2-dehydro-3-deoxyphosphogluconate aldolase/(4S)-4-hydroxy-2-oxoglutarate aldolase
MGMDKERILQGLIAGGVVAVVRLPAAGQLRQVATALQAGGVQAIEFTMTTPGALDVLREVTAEPGDILFGAGTVLDPETARAAILAGAQFIISPTLNPKVIELCHRYSKVAIPGAFTPTEILTAWELGADIVKVFPATALGPQYFRDILAPLPQVRLLPTGGVSLENAGEFIRAGAVAVAVGSNLVDRKAVAEGRFQDITETARRFREVVERARRP